MAKFLESPVVFTHEDAVMMGICSHPPEPGSIGVLILVGGPQYRVGSHRQFVLLARALAEAGTTVMRFDFSGTGDSSGRDRTFEGRNDEIHAAIDAFLAHAPSVKQVVLWGLCDAASAALFYAPTDQRVAGVTLLNPWVRSQAGLAKTHLKHYYGARLRDPAFWKKLFSGSLNPVVAIKGWFATLKTSRQNSSDASAESAMPFQLRMAHAWRSFQQGGSIQLILSGNDLTAKEFIDHAAVEPGWSGLLQFEGVVRRDLIEADHTFSCRAWRDQVARWTMDWLDTIKEKPR